MNLPVLTLAAALLAAAASCDESGSPTGPGLEPVAFETILQRSLPGQPGSTLREAARDQAAWNALWARLRQGDGTLPEQPPAVATRLGTRALLCVCGLRSQRNLENREFSLTLLSPL